MEKITGFSGPDGYHEFDTLKDALAHATEDPTLWKIMAPLTTGEVVILEWFGGQWILDGGS